MDKLKSLIGRACAGDPEAFGAIVLRFQNMAYGCAYSYLRNFQLAEDAAQEAFLEAYRQLPNLRQPEAFPGWLRCIVFKYCDRITRSRHMRAVSLDDAADVADGDAGPAKLAEERETQEKVLGAIHALPETQRMVTTLFYIDGYSQKEIAGFLEVPVTTVKKRLHDSRKNLKEIMDMVKTTLKKNALPENFAERLLMFPFPQREPEVKITDCSGDNFKVRCIDAQQFFVPLTEGGKCDWTFYDWPGGRLTGVYESHVISSAKRKQGNLLRIWTRFTDLKKKSKPEWQEEHLFIENDTYRCIELKRERPGELNLAPYFWNGEELSEATPMKLKVGTKWDPATEVTGVSQVTIAGHSWKCLKVVTIDKHTYAEWYIAKTGRTVFFRRFNGAGYRKPENPASFESLKGNLEIKHKGIAFRHWYDCIPDIGVERALG